jgi:hypothetical protein
METAIKLTGDKHPSHQWLPVFSSPMRNSLEEHKVTTPSKECHLSSLSSPHIDPAQFPCGSEANSNVNELPQKKFACACAAQWAQDVETLILGQ